MHPEEFPEANTVYTKPDSMTDEQCASLPAWRGCTDEGHPAIVSFWKPSYEDIQALKAGNGIYVTTFSDSLPPMSLSVESPFLSKS